MKTFTYRLWVLFALLMFNSCGETKKEQGVEVDSPEEVKRERAAVRDQFNQEFTDGVTGTLWNYYSKIRMSLVNSDANAAQTAAGDIAESFGEKHSELKQISFQMAETTDLEAQRTLFSELSAGLEPIFRNALSEGEIYKQYCPMAFDNEGAYWLSGVSEIENPYFGNKMLKCGTTREVITNPNS